MWNAILTVLDKVIDLLKLRSERKARVFREQIQPIFTQASAAATDLLKFCREALVLLKNVETADDGLYAIGAAKERLIERRNEFLTVRAEIEALASELSDEYDRDELLRRFAEKLLWYFGGPQRSIPRSLVSAFERFQSAAFGRDLGSLASVLDPGSDVIEFVIQERRQLVQRVDQLEKGWRIDRARFRSTEAATHRSGGVVSRAGLLNPPNGTLAKLRAAPHTSGDAARPLPRLTFVRRKRSATGVTPSQMSQPRRFSAGPKYRRFDSFS
jgi:hypothetical protein